MNYAAKLDRNSVRIVNTANGSTVRTISGAFQTAPQRHHHHHRNLQVLNPPPRPTSPSNPEN